MKEASQFHFIESEHQHFIDPLMGHNLFEEQKIANPFDQVLNEEVDQQNILNTPKGKRGRKSSIKNNPQENSASKKVKIKQKKTKQVNIEPQKNPNQLFGHWSVEQNKRYHWFLQTFHSHFMNRSLRRMDRIFTSMAKFVGTREAQQCRSHHQKMQKKHKTFPKILLSLRMAYYSSHNDLYLREDMQKNQVPITDSLLTEQFLIQNIAMKQISHESEQEKEQIRQQNQQKEQKQSIKMEKKKEIIKQVSAEIIEQVLAPDIESSKNYYKFLSTMNERNNILDDGYESNLPFSGFF